VTTAAALPGVLVLDDEPHMRTVLDLTLRRHGFPVWPAADGREALDLYRRHGSAIGVLLLDVHLPGGLDGPATLRALREAHPDASWSAYFMTGHAGAYTAEELLGLGAERVLTKPLDLVKLVQLLRGAGNPASAGG
jgi:CheY-like chemotaxis protein